MERLFTIVRMRPDALRFTAGGSCRRGRRRFMRRPLQLPPRRKVIRSMLQRGAVLLGRFLKPTQ